MPGFGDMLSALRRRDGLSQKELAQKAGVSRSAIGMYETGEREPSFETLQLFADIFHVRAETLLGAPDRDEALVSNALLAAVVSEKADIAPGLFDYRLNIPDTNETTFPLLANIPLQLLAYYIADSLGREVDQPRNLAKSVTVE